MSTKMRIDKYHKIHVHFLFLSYPPIFKIIFFVLCKFMRKYFSIISFYAFHNQFLLIINCLLLKKN